MSGILILGGAGMLGQALAAKALERGLDFMAVSRHEVDVTDRAQLDRAVAEQAPSVIVNCAAFTDVDGCETERALAYEVNGTAVEGMARAADRSGALLVQVSTDYVFDGHATRAYREDDPTMPISVYGHSKLVGERAALSSKRGLVVRTSWLFGPGGNNFVTAIVARARTGEGLRVVDDQLGCPTYTPSLATAILELAELAEKSVFELPAIVHFRNRERVTWFGFARAILEVWGLDCEIEPVSTEEFPRPARRPPFSVLDPGRFESWTGRRVDEWHPALADYRARLEAAP